MDESTPDGIVPFADFDIPHHVLIRAKIGEQCPLFRLTPDEARNLARRLDGLADLVEHADAAGPLGKPIRIKETATPMMAPRYEAIDA